MEVKSNGQITDETNILGFDDKHTVEWTGMCG